MKRPNADKVRGRRNINPIIRWIATIACTEDELVFVSGRDIVQTRQRLMKTPTGGNMV